MSLVCGLALLVTATSCGPSDPLERVRLQQDEKGDFHGSLSPLRKLLDERPNDPEVQYRYGNALIQVGDSGFEEFGPLHFLRIREVASVK